MDGFYQNVIGGLYSLKFSNVFVKFVSFHLEHLRQYDGTLKTSFHPCCKFWVLVLNAVNSISPSLEPGQTDAHNACGILVGGLVVSPGSPKNWSRLLRYRIQHSKWRPSRHMSSCSCSSCLKCLPLRAKTHLYVSVL